MNTTIPWVYIFCYANRKNHLPNFRKRKSKKLRAINQILAPCSEQSKIKKISYSTADWCLMAIDTIGDCSAVTLTSSRYVFNCERVVNIGVHVHGKPNKEIFTLELTVGDVESYV